jgi:hypothetical protein
MAKKYYMLYISFVVNNMKEWDDGAKFTKRLEKVLGQSISGAGTGFGVRDIEFYYTNKKKADAAKKMVVKHIASKETNPRYLASNISVVTYERD